MTTATEPAVRSTLVPQLLLLCMIAIWGGSFVGIKVGLGSWPPFSFVALRFWIGLLCVLPFLPRCGGLRALRVSMMPGLITGIVLAAGYGCQTFGMTGTTASKAGFAAGLVVVLVPAGALVFLGERLQRGAVVGLLFGLLGVLLLCLEDDLSLPHGDLLQVVAAAVYAVHILLIARLSPPGAAVAYCAWQLLVVAAGGSLCSALLELPAGLPPTTATLWTALLYTGALASALAIAVQSRVQPMIPSAQVALLFATEPLFAAGAGWLLLGETMDPRQWLGGALIVVGIVVAIRRS